MQFTTQEKATVLAALRYWQTKIERDRLPKEIVSPELRLLNIKWNIPGILLSHFDEVNPLNSDEIDQLCERVNFEEPPVITIEVRGGVAYEADNNDASILVKIVDYDNLEDEP